MHKKLGLRSGKGNRNIFCPEYTECLNIAALANWNAFHCEGCHQYTKNGDMMKTGSKIESMNASTSGGGMSPPVCKVPGCKDRVKARGFCSRCYDSWRTGSLAGDWPKFKTIYKSKKQVKSQKSSSPRSLSALDKQVGGDHYRKFQIQPIEFIVKNRLDFLQGSVIKRICRYNVRGGKGLEDLDKIKHEVDLIIEFVRQNQTQDP